MIVMAFVVATVAAFVGFQLGVSSTPTTGFESQTSTVDLLARKRPTPPSSCYKQKPNSPGSVQNNPNCP